jgi:Predicted ATP-binding protein involved in virulence
MSHEINILYNLKISFLLGNTRVFAVDNHVGRLTILPLIRAILSISIDVNLRILTKKNLYIFYAKI